MAEIVAPLFFNHYLIPKDLPEPIGTRTKKKPHWFLRPALCGTHNQTAVITHAIVIIALCALLMCTIINIQEHHRTCRDDRAAESCSEHQAPGWLWMIRILMAASSLTFILSVLLGWIPPSPLAYAGLSMAIMVSFLVLMLPIFAVSILESLYVLILPLFILLSLGSLLKIFVVMDRARKALLEMERMKSGRERNDLAMIPSSFKQISPQPPYLL